MNVHRIQIVSAMLLVGSAVGQGALGSVKAVDLGGDQFLVTFTFEPPADMNSVNLAGTFNHWNPTALRMQAAENGKAYTTELTLRRGRYEYKFVVNGSEWFTDPDNPIRVGPNENSLLVLGELSAQTAIESGRTANMPGQMEHPPEIKTAIDGPRLCGNKSTRIFGVQFHFPMPYITDSTITFIAKAPHGHSAWLDIMTPSSRFGYELEPLDKAVTGLDSLIRGITLDRKEFPSDATYLFKYSNGESTKSSVDPNAWSITSRAGQPVGAIIEPSVKAGRIRLIENLHSPDQSLRSRDIYIYLPPGYGDTYTPSQLAIDKESRYPVVYLHDGQNCWDDPSEPFGHGGWAINLIADKLINSGEVEPFIAVGIANTPVRLKEYGPGEDILSADSHVYLQFIAKTLKPLIDEKYRTLPGPEHTSMMGSSMGGAISFQGAMLMPDVFGSAACLSTAFMFKDANDKGYTELVEHRGKQPVSLYLDSGTGGRHQDGAPATRAMVELLKAIGWQPGFDLEHFEDEGADHNERAWRARVDRPLRFLFGKD